MTGKQAQTIPAQASAILPDEIHAVVVYTYKAREMKLASEWFRQACVDSLRRRNFSLEKTGGGGTAYKYIVIEVSSLYLGADVEEHAASDCACNDGATKAAVS